MKKFTGSLFSSFLLSGFLTALLFLSGCSSNKQYFSFTPAPPAYVKKAVAPAVAVTPAEAAKPTENINDEPASTALTASTAPAQQVVLPEVAALKEANTQVAAAGKATTAKNHPGAKSATSAQKITLAQKVVLHKVQKQVKKLNNQAQAAAGPVSNRSAIALILIGVVLAVFATLIGGGLGNLFYTLGILALLIGLVLLILNYI